MYAVCVEVILFYYFSIFDFLAGKLQDFSSKKGFFSTKKITSKLHANLQSSSCYNTFMD